MLKGGIDPGPRQRCLSRVWSVLVGLAERGATISKAVNATNRVTALSQLTGLVSLIAGLYLRRRWREDESQRLGPFPVRWTRGRCRPGLRETQQWVRHA